MVKSVGLAGPAAIMCEQVGYSLADVLDKAVFGVLIWAIAAEKSAIEESGKLLSNRVFGHRYLALLRLI